MGFTTLAGELAAGHRWLPLADGKVSIVVRSLFDVEAVYPRGVVVRACAHW